MLQKNQRLMKTTQSSQQLISATNFLNQLEQTIYLSGPWFPGGGGLGGGVKCLRST